MRFKCPDCGGRGRAYYYPHGGGTTVCYSCGKRLYVMPTRSGIIIRAAKKPHPLTIRTEPVVSNAARPEYVARGVSVNGF